MTAAALHLEVSVHVVARQRVNLVEFFQAMDPREQDRYKALDIHHLGMEADWEWPLAYLWPDEHDVVPLSLVPRAQSHVSGDISDAALRLSARGGEMVFGRDAEWTEDDFETLKSHVPWLAAFHDTLTTPLTAEERARIPGPDDVPLF